MGIIRILASYSAILTFALYITFKHKLNVSEIYSILLLFMSIEEPMSWFFNSWIVIKNGIVPLKKLCELLRIENFKVSLKKGNLGSGEVKIENGSFSWDNLKYKKILKSFIPPNLQTIQIENEENRIFFKNLNLYFKAKKFYAVVGQVGSGKSSLINCIID